MPDHSTFGTIAATLVSVQERSGRRQDFRVTNSESRLSGISTSGRMRLFQTRGNAFLDRDVRTLDEFRYLNTGFHHIEILDLAVTGSGEGVRTKPSGCS